MRASGLRDQDIQTGLGLLATAPGSRRASTRTATGICQTDDNAKTKFTGTCSPRYPATILERFGRHVLRILPGRSAFERTPSHQAPQTLGYPPDLMKS